MLFLFCCRDRWGGQNKEVHLWRGKGTSYILWVCVEDWKREGEREPADGNGNAVSGEMRKGGRKGDGEGERQSERGHSLYAVAPAPRKKCKTSGAPLPVTSLIPILPPSPAFLPFLTSPSQRGPEGQSLDSLYVRGRLQCMSPPLLKDNAAREYQQAPSDITAQLSNSVDSTTRYSVVVGDGTLHGTEQ